MLRRVIAALGPLAVFVAPFGYGTELDLKAALDGQKVRVAVTGLGGSTGDAIQVIVQRLINEPLSIAVSPGTVLKAVDASVQDMIVAQLKGERIDDKSYRARARIELTNGEVHRYIVESYCLDFEKANPTETSRFKFGPPNDRVAKVVAQGKAKGLDIKAIQAALWMDRSHVDGTTLKRRFPIEDSQIAEGRGLLSWINSTSVQPEDGPKTPAPPVALVAARDPALEEILWEDVRPDSRYLVFFRDGIQYMIDSDLQKGLDTYEYSLDASQSPKHYNSYFLGMQLAGIYKVENDTACIKLTGVGKPRPTDFDGSGIRTLRRVPGQDKWRRQLEALGQIRQIQQLMLGH